MGKVALCGSRTQHVAPSRTLALSHFRTVAPSHLRTFAFALTQSRVAGADGFLLRGAAGSRDDLQAADGIQRIHGDWTRSAQRLGELGVEAGVGAGLGRHRLPVVTGA